MKLGLLTPATITFQGSDLGKFDRDSEVNLTITPIYNEYSKSNSNHILERRIVRKECTLKCVTKWSKEAYDSFTGVVRQLSPSGTIVIDTSELNITINNMQIKSESFQNFGGKGGFNLTFECKDKNPNINIIEK